MIYREVFFALALLALLGWQSPLPRIQSRSHSPLERLCLLLGAFYAAIYFLAALAPEVSDDAVAYHLGLVRLFQAHHRMAYYPETFTYALPQGMGMVYLFCSSLGGYSIARLAHLACLVALAAAIRALGARLGYSEGGSVAAVAVFSASVFGVTATTAYVDVALTLAVFLAFYAAFLWRESGDRRHVWIAGLMSGLAMSIKPTGAVSLPLVTVMALWPGAPRTGPTYAFLRRLRIALLITLLASAVFVPWAGRNWAVFQNPLMPLANRWFPNPYLLPSSEAAFLKALRHPDGFGRDWRDYAGWPWEVTLGGSRLHGFVGPFFLLTPLALLAAKKREGRWLLAAGLVAGAPVAANILTRFLMPGLPFLSLGIVIGAYLLLPARAAHLALGLALTVQGVVNLPWMIARRSETVYFALREVPVRAAFRLESERDYLARKLEHFPAIEFLEKGTPAGTRVLAFGAVHQAYTSRFLLPPLASEFSRTLVRALHSAGDPGLVPERQIQARFPPVRARALLLKQPGAAPDLYWSIYELEVISGAGQPLSRQQLRYSASVNHFEAPLVADGRVFSGWSTGAPLEAGTWFKVDLGREQEVQEIRYTVPPKEELLLPNVLVSLDGNHWTPVKAEFGGAKLGSRNWRAEATALLKSRGMDYLLLVNRPGSPYAALFADLLEKSEQWGLREVFRSGEAVVLQLEPASKVSNGGLSARCVRALR